MRALRTRLTALDTAMAGCGAPAFAGPRLGVLGVVDEVLQDAVRVAKCERLGLGSCGGGGGGGDAAASDDTRAAARLFTDAAAAIVEFDLEGALRTAADAWLWRSGCGGWRATGRSCGTARRH